MPKTFANGVWIHYDMHGPADQPVVVLNNGILMTTASWRYQVPALGETYRVLTYDLRGQGQSDHPAAPWTMADHADDLAALLDALGLGPAHVLGISYGGEVAQAFALRHRSRVRSLILADTVSEVDPVLALIVEGWRRVAASGDADTLFAVTVPWTFSPDFLAAHPALLDEARRRYRELDLPAVARLCDAFLGVAFTHALATLRVPTCVIVGELDRLKGLPHAERLASAIAGAELHVIPGAGHATCWEQPEAFNAIVLDFLARVPRPAAAVPGDWTIP